MSGSKCSLCKRNVEKASLIRCRETRCPSRVRKTGASPSVMIGGAIGILLLCGILLGSWIYAAPGDRRAAPFSVTASSDNSSPVENSTDDTSRQVAGHSESKVAKWFDALVSAPKPTEVVEQTDQSMNSDRPDPRAATRVMNFSCAAGVSASRSRICTDWTLATVDYNLSLFYRSVLSRSRNPVALRRANAVWLAKLDKLGNDNDALLKFYTEWREDISRF